MFETVAGLFLITLVCPDPTVKGLEMPDANAARVNAIHEARQVMADEGHTGGFASLAILRCRMKRGIQC